MSEQNREIQLASYPQGLPEPDNFTIVDAPMPSPGEGEVVLKVIYQSMDPFPRLRLNPDSKTVPPLPLGEVMIGRGVGQVVASNHPDFQPGDFAAGEVGWRLFAAVPGANLAKVDPAHGPISTSLGVLGPSGIAAYFALLELGQPQAGDTVLVTAAAGSVGSVACQIAKLKDCRVIGIAGGAEEIEYLEKDLGVDAAVDWKADDFAEQLASAAENGINVFFDGVGGDIHNQVMKHMSPHGRVALVGYVSAYNPESGEPQQYGDIFAIVHKRLTVRGFFAPDFGARAGEALGALAQWIKDGKISYREEISDGFEQLPVAFKGLFSGFKPGKKLVRTADDPSA